MPLTKEDKNWIKSELRANNVVLLKMIESLFIAHNEHTHQLIKACEENIRRDLKIIA